MEITIITTFAIILSFSLLNLLLSMSIYLSSKKDLYSKLGLFWFALIVNFFIQAMAQKNESLIILAYGFTLLPLNFLGYASTHLIKRPYPIKAMTVISLSSILLSSMLCMIVELPFFMKALPLSLGTAAPMIYVSWLFLYKNRDQASLIMKIEASVLILIAIHCINFAIFRMDPSTQLWGWLVSYACYQSLAGILPTLSLEFYHKEERARLKAEIAEKTKHLKEANREINATLTEKTFLIRALVHDVSNPLTVILVKSQFFKKTPESSEFIHSVQKMAKRIQNIITQFRNFEKFNDYKSIYKGKKSNFIHTLNETLEMFHEKIKNKSLAIDISGKNISDLDVVELEVDSVVMINSVLSNFISNAIKFSNDSGTIRVIYEILDDCLHFSVINYGVGMSRKKVESLYKFDTNETMPGTEGEKGTGFGIPIANRIIERAGGNLKIKSNDKKNTGPIYTEMKVTLPCTVTKQNKAYNQAA